MVPALVRLLSSNTANNCLPPPAQLPPYRLSIYPAIFKPTFTSLCLSIYPAIFKPTFIRLCLSI